VLNRIEISLFNLSTPHRLKTLDKLYQTLSE